MPLLNKQKVKGIRAHAEKGMSQRKIAAKYGVSRSTVYDVIHKITWAKV